ncbi:MAG: DUF2283 domain-containing protein [Candidatus Subteraquimicrobiales bacterium]|jgi:uncharacterized protein YuzE|nr:DUF2283 domain-containing protein [Candidatus Subteraquimicrobiales bacterium]
METKIAFKYDREADILYINKRTPYPEQESEEVGDDIIARINPTTGEVENIEILFFSTRLLRDSAFEVPVTLGESRGNFVNASANG